MPLTSVLLPVKDGAPTLEMAIRSTLRAMPKDSELVVLDDGSRDHPEEVLERIKDPRLRLIRNELSRGVGAGLQRLLRGTDSRFVMRMDADDVCLPGRFSSQIRALRHADVAFAPIINFWDGSHRLRPSLPAPIEAQAMPLHLAIHNLLCHPTMAAKRQALQDVGGYRSVVAEDYDLWLRCVAAGLSVVRTAQPVIAYRQHGGQVSAQDGYVSASWQDPKLREAYIDFVDRCFGLFPTWLDALWSGESGTPQMTLELAPLRALLEERSRGLGSMQQWVLARTVRLLNDRDILGEEGNE